MHNKSSNTSTLAEKRDVALQAVSAFEACPPRDLRSGLYRQVIRKQFHAILGDCRPAKTFTPLQLGAGRRCRDDQLGYDTYGGVVDHPEYFQNGRPFLMVSHTYVPRTPENRARFAEEMRRFGLVAHYPDFPSWYYPGAGGATLIVISRPDWVPPKELGC